MLQSALSRLETIVGADGETHVANAAMDAFRIQSANVGVVGEELVACIHAYAFLLFLVRVRG